MKSMEKYDLKISGNMQVAGGSFKDVLISGVGILTTDVECDFFKISGSAETKGNVLSKRGKVSGKTDIEGNLISEEFEVFGKMNVNGSGQIKEMKVEGTSAFKGSLSTEKLNVKGSIEVGKDCNAEEFKSRGNFQIGGLLNAENIDMQLHWRSKAKEIGGETIVVKRGRGSSLKKILKALFLPAEFLEGTLTADTIEGDTIHLEYTKAKVVRGQKVYIGTGCEIELVEYTDHFEESADAIVRETRKQAE
ncbi:hypothetical protein [Metabacillus sp. RGM 3146]|uniref:hypothetical protein n=1 Tax=Metabacillus sp. RGM 3146 TaxID=3401092 RepID=UPI003B9C9FCD